MLEGGRKSAKIGLAMGGAIGGDAGKMARTFIFFGDNSFEAII